MTIRGTLSRSLPFLLAALLGACDVGDDGLADHPRGSTIAPGSPNTVRSDPGASEDRAGAPGGVAVGQANPGASSGNGGPGASGSGVATGAPGASGPGVATGTAARSCSCDNLPIPEVACAQGTTTPVCREISFGKCAWEISCGGTSPTPAPGCGDPPAPPPSIICPDLLCRQVCEHGFVKDRNGCETCACNPPPSSNAPQTWGGKHIEMRVVPGRAGAEVEFDCASGRIDEALPLKGDFRLKGIYTAGQGGPSGPGQVVSAESAVWFGTMASGRMKLSVQLVSTKKLIGPFELELGKRGELFRCL
jgi:hypothetical protein